MIRHATIRRLVLALLVAGSTAGCAVAIRTNTDRSTIGGGPEQATAVARSQIQATIVAIATANPGTLGSSQPCDCDSR